MLRWILDDEKLIECKMNIRNNATNRQYNTNKMKQLSQCSGVLTINVLCVLCFLDLTRHKTGRLLFWAKCFKID